MFRLIAIFVLVCAGAAVPVPFAHPDVRSARGRALEDPVKVGVLLDRVEDSAEPFRGFRRAAAIAAKEWNSKEPRRQVALVERGAATKGDVPAAIASMLEAGAVAVLVPPAGREWVDAVVRAARGKLACVGFGSVRQAEVDALNRLFDRREYVTRIAIAHDRSRPARDFVKMLEDGALPFPTQLVLELDFRVKPKKIDKKVAEHEPEILIVDGAADAASEFLGEAWQGRGIPIVLTPRSFGTVVPKGTVGAMAVLGQSPATRASSGSFRADFEAAHGVVEYGVAEGYEAVQIAARAIAAAGGASADAAGVTKALGGVTAEGARGRVVFDADAGYAMPPLATWKWVDGALQPHDPPAISLEVAEAGTMEAEREPDPDLGEPLRTWKTRQFEFEPGTQWVLCDWGLPGKRTIDDDLAKLGLSTGGKSPIVDRIIKDELMARIIAITSTKFGRNADGTAVPGKSLNISFAAYRPDVKKRRLWPAHFAGDDSGAGGRAYGTYCEIYTTFIRRTIFQPHALEPAVTADDLTYLDGSYVFGTDHLRDKRSELIRALINGYAGSMALTTAHEVGHLGGLGHITNDPRGIMNVEEGAGLDYREASFSAGSWEKLVAKFGLAEEPGKKGKKKRGSRR